MLSANIGDRSLRPDGPELHDDALAKPFDLRQLLDKLQKHLDLTWTDDLSEREPETNGEPATGAIVNPGRSHVQELISLGEIGYIHGIEAKTRRTFRRS